MELLKKIKVMYYIETVEEYLEKCDELCKEYTLYKKALA